MNLCESGGVVQLRRKKGVTNTPTKPNSLGSLLQQRRQEIQYDLESRYSDDLDQYSDTGYPSLPRPKTVLSLSRASLPRSFNGASLGSTPPTRQRNGTRKTESQLSTCKVAAANTAGLLVNSKVNRESTSLAKQSKRKSFAEIFKGNKSAGRAELELEIESNNCSSVAGKMSNLGRVYSRKGPSSAAGGGGEDEGNQKSKKSRKPSKSHTFSFGSHSDRKRRTLGFLGKGERKKTPLEVSSSTIPASPILVSRKMKTLPASSTSGGLLIPIDNRQEVPVHHHGSVQTQYGGSYQDISVKSPFRGGKHRPPPLSNLSSSVGQLAYHRKEVESPQTDYSPALTSTSGMSSRQESSESLSFSTRSDTPQALGSVSTPSSRRESPNVLRSNYRQGSLGYKATVQTTLPRVQRKLSDPIVSALSTEESPDPSPQQGRGLKKRNTFCVRPSPGLQNPQQGWIEMRQHVVRFLLETEQSYVESLKIILKVYYEPLKRPGVTLVEPYLVKDIFYQIPELCSLHELFLHQLSGRVQHWDAERKIGDIFVNTFSKCLFVDIYRKFIGNFMKAKASIEIAKQSKSIFSKFLEQRVREGEGKLTLDDLLIKPVQRIPRYVLFVKDLLKHTAPGHPDHTPLQQALGELTTLAEKVNDSEKERERLGQHKDLLTSVEGLAQLLSPQSHFISYNMVTEVKGHVQKRDRFLILFSDILICVSSRRKSTSFKRSSLLNLNSVFTEGLKYNIKWHVPLTKMSVAQIQTPSFDSRRQNTLEKLIQNLQKDDSVLQEMLEISSSIHHPHQALVATLKELQAEVREGVTSKKTQLDNLPLECSRIDLVSYTSLPPTQYTLLFPSLKIKDLWEKEFLQVKGAADCKAPPTSSVAPPTSPLPVQVCPSHDLVFQNSIILQSVKSGMQLTCATEGLGVGPTSSSCLWVCCSSDGLGGQVSLLNLQSAASPQVVANITVSESPITCLSAIPTTPPAAQHPPPPDISVSSISSSSSSEHVALSPTSSFASDIKSVPSDKDDDVMFIDGELDLSTSAVAATPTQSPFPASLVVNRVRSNSAPPIPDGLLEDIETRVPSPATGQQTLSAQISLTDASNESSRKVWSALTLRPSSLGENGEGSGCGHCMWLGTEGGQIHIYKVGDSLRSRSTRKTVELGSAVRCIRYFRGSVYVGLSNGTLNVFDACDPTSVPHFNVMTGDWPIQACVCVLDELWVACGASLYRLDPTSNTLKVLCSLPTEQLIEGVHPTGNSVWVSVHNSPFLHLFHAPSGILITSINCTPPVVQLFKACDPTSRQHRNTSLRLHVTSLHSSCSHLVVGTSSGIVLAIPLPYMEPSLEPHPLPHPPVPAPLYHGHRDNVHFLFVMQREGVPLLITGGNGHRDYTSVETAPTTASCLLLWGESQ